MMTLLIKIFCKKIFKYFCQIFRIFLSNYPKIFVKNSPNIFVKFFYHLEKLSFVNISQNTINLKTAKSAMIYLSLPK